MNTNMKNPLSVIAFLDILGAKEIINKNADESLNLVYKSYTEAIAQYKKRTDSHFPIPKIKIFSDNISISFCIDENFDNIMECIFSVILFCSVLTM